MMKRLLAWGAPMVLLCVALQTRDARAQEETPEKWAGVDETVVEKFAEDAGRPPREPLINVGEGDMLLFCFLLAGAAGGFVLGYTWRSLFGKSAAPGSDATDHGGQ